MILSQKPQNEICDYNFVNPCDVLYYFLLAILMDSKDMLILNCFFHIYTVSFFISASSWKFTLLGWLFVVTINAWISWNNFEWEELWMFFNGVCFLLFIFVLVGLSMTLIRWDKQRCLFFTYLYKISIFYILKCLQLEFFCKVKPYNKKGIFQDQRRWNSWNSRIA